MESKNFAHPVCGEYFLMDQMQVRDAQATAGLLVPGRNCWRIEHAKRLRFQVDGCEYFAALRAAITRAQRTVFILGWDIDSRIRLRPEGANDGFPETLADFLNAVVASRRALRMYVLSWDFAMLYALEREWLPVYKLDWRTHRRLSFRLDGHHPTGAAHHQKLVVVDDAIAFVGGLDLTRRRWDTSAHLCDDPRRVDPDGKPYPPFHDVQAMVDGDAARALGELARERWSRATGRRPRLPDAAPASDPWPPDHAPDLTDVSVAIARTEPAFEGHPGTAEIRQLYMDAIAAARRHIYVENQYFTSGVITDAIAARLREARGPEAVIVSPREESGWLGRKTMGVLRVRVHRCLREADLHRRYRLYCPEVPGLGASCLNLHSKVLVADDDFLTIGSANLNNRSMGLDTECNLALEARGDERVQRGIAGLRNRLLSEHLGTKPEKVAEEIATRASLIGAVETLENSTGRSLKPLEPVVTPDIDAQVPNAALFDTERPVDPDALVAEFVPRDAKQPVANHMRRIASAVLLLATVAAAWHFTPLEQWLDVDSVIAVASTLKDTPLAPVTVVVSYVFAGLLILPIVVLIAATGIVFGPVMGGLYALAGSLLSAIATYAIGRWLGRDTVRRFAGARVNKLSRKLGARGLIAVVIVRIVPIAPFTVVNVVAGASHISFRDFVLGTIIGMTPGIAATVVFVDRIAAAISDPSPGTFASLAAIAAALVGAVVLVRRRLGGSGEDQGAVEQR